MKTKASSSDLLGRSPKATSRPSRQLQAGAATSGLCWPPPPRGKASALAQQRLITTVCHCRHWNKCSKREESKIIRPLSQRPLSESTQTQLFMFFFPFPISTRRHFGTSASLCHTWEMSQDSPGTRLLHKRAPEWINLVISEVSPGWHHAPPRPPPSQGPSSPHTAMLHRRDLEKWLVCSGLIFHTHKSHVKIAALRKFTEVSSWHLNS